MSKRKPLIAIGASLMWPGLGHVYAGRALRGFLFFGLGILGLSLALSAGANEFRPFGPLVALAGLLLFVAPAWDSARLCKALPTSG